MIAGKLDRRITIQDYTEVQDEYGQPEETWSTLCTVWAKVTSISTNERVRSGALHSAITSSFLIRWRSGIDEKMRIAFENNYYRITGIKEVGRREGLELTGEVVK